MSRQLEQIQEQRTAKRHLELVKTIEYGLLGAVSHSGGILSGFTIKINDGECLLVLKADFGHLHRVAFVSGEDVGTVLIRGMNLARRDALNWKADAYYIDND